MRRMAHFDSHQTSALGSRPEHPIARENLTASEVVLAPEDGSALQDLTSLLGDSCSSHRWGCPVIMKTDPEHVAWTCSRCGELAFTAVGERPAAPGRSVRCVPLRRARLIKTARR